MVERCTLPTTATADLGVDHLDESDKELMQALVTAGALVALSNGRIESVERDELVNFIDERNFVPTISRSEICEAFDARVRQLDDRYSANIIVDTFRPLAGLSLASVVVRTALRVAGADGKIDVRELRALNLIRQVLMTLPATRAS